MTPSESRPGRGSGWLWLPITLIGLWRVALEPVQVWSWPGGKFSDLLISHLPNAEFVHRALTTWRQFPLWNPTILSGMPLAGDPLAGVWYPPLWLTIAIPTPTIFNLLFWFHLAWGAWGMARLARSEGLSEGAGWIAGAVFAASPKLLGQYGLGHATLVMAVCWTPWVLVGVHRLVAAADLSSRRKVGQALMLGSLVGVVFLADPRWLIPVLMLVGVVGVRLILTKPAPAAAQWRTWAVQTGLAGLQSALVAAWLALPMWVLVHQSTRTMLDVSQSAALSLPAARLLGLILPDLGGWPEWMAYVGLAGLLLATVAIVLKGRGGGFWAGVVVAAWILALGDGTPAYPILAGLIPGLAWLRVPARFLFVGIVAMAILAGIGWDALRASVSPPSRIRTLNLLAAGWSALFFTLGGAGILAAGAWATPAVKSSLILAGLAGVGSGMLVFLRAQLAGTQRRFLIAWLGMILLELAAVDGSLLGAKPTDPLPQSLKTLAPRSPQETPSRVFSPSYSIPQDAASDNGLELADGVNPLQLASYWRFMSGATGYPLSPYSVTLPPYPSGDPQVPWPIHLDAEKLGWLAVAEVVSAYPLDGHDLSQTANGDGSYVYSNQAARPRAWVQAGESLVPAPEWSGVSTESWTPNAIRLSADGPGRLVLSEVAYPGWTARVDGKLEPVETVGGLLRSVTLGPGQHQVEFSFLPWTFLAGTGLSLVGLALAICAWWLR